MHLNFESIKNTKKGEGQWDDSVVKGPRHNPDIPSSISTTHVVEGKNWLLHAVLWPPYAC